MAYTHIATLTTNNGNTYANSDEWMAEHGSCGLNNSLVVSGSIVADGTGTVTRTLVYASRDDRVSHVSNKPSGLGYTATFVSESTD